MKKTKKGKVNKQVKYKCPSCGKISDDKDKCCGEKMEQC